MNWKHRGSPIKRKTILIRLSLYFLFKCFSTCADPFLPVQLPPHLIPTYLISYLLSEPHCYPTIPKFFLAIQPFLPPASLSIHLSPLLFQRTYQPCYHPTQSSIFLGHQPQCGLYQGSSMSILGLLTLGVDVVQRVDQLRFWTGTEEGRNVWFKESWSVVGNHGPEKLTR